MPNTVNILSDLEIYNNLFLGFTPQFLNPTRQGLLHLYTCHLRLTFGKRSLMIIKRLFGFGEAVVGKIQRIEWHMWAGASQTVPVCQR